jgi:hypothetical protein
VHQLVCLHQHVDSRLLCVLPLLCCATIHFLQRKLFLSTLRKVIRWTISQWPCCFSSNSQACCGRRYSIEHIASFFKQFPFFLCSLRLHSL